MATSTQVRKVLLQLQADDGDTEAKLDAIKAKADELAELHPELAVKIQDAAAKAELKVLRQEIQGASGPQPPVELTADDEAAKAKVEELQAKLKELGTAAADVKINADDSAAEAKVLRLKAQLASLGETVSRPDISVAGMAKAEADIAAVKASMDVLGKESEKTASDSGGESGGFFGNSFVQTFLGGKKSTIIAAVASAMAALPALGAVAGVGMVAGLGVAIADKIPSVAAKFKQLGDQAMSMLETAVKPMVPYIDGAVKQASGFLKSIGPELAGMFKDVGPMLQPLLGGLESLVKGVLPGLSDMLKAAMPAVTAFGSVLGSLGKDAGGLFSSMAPAVKASAGVMKALFDAVGGVLPVVGKLAAAFATSLAPILSQVAGLVKAMEPGFTAVAHVVAEFAQAFLGNLQGGMSAVIGLMKGIIPAVNTLAGAFGKVFNLLNNRGVFNDVEDSLEQLVGPLSKLTVALVQGLAPAIPAVVSLLQSMANILQAGMTTAITGLANGFTALIKAMPPSVMKAIGVGLGLWVTYSKLLGPAKSAISGVGKAFGFITGLPGKIAGFASSLGSAADSAVMFAGRVASQLAKAASATVAWIAEHAVATAEFIAQNVAQAASATAAFIAENAATLGIVAGIGLLVAGGIYLATHWKQVWGDVKKYALDAWHFLDGDVIHPIQRGIGALVSWIKGHWPLLLGILTGPIGLAASEILTHLHKIEQIFDDLRHDVAAIVDGLWHDEVNTWKKIYDDTVAVARRLWGDVTGGFRTLGHDLTSIAATLWHDEVDGWKRIVSDVVGVAESLWNRLVTGFRKLPGEIVSALGNLGSLLFSSGKKIIQGLINGITSMIGSVTHAIGSVVDEIKSHLPFSPAKKGPLSGAGAPDKSGRSIPRLIAAGMESGMPEVSAATERMARAMIIPRSTGSAGLIAGLTTAGSAGSAASAGNRPLQIEWVGGGGADQQFISWLKKQIRIRGGDPANVGA